MKALMALAAVVVREGAEVVVIAGDLFDSNRIRRELVDRTCEVLESARVPIYVLPGNHDPLTAESVYDGTDRWPSNVRVFRTPAGEAFLDPDLPVELWGRPHTSYGSFRPFDGAPAWSGRKNHSRWRIAVGHGHFEPNNRCSRHSYVITGMDLERTNAHYVALGHWDTHERVHSGEPPAWYSGSPCRTGAFALVEFSGAAVSVKEVKWN